MKDILEAIGMFIAVVWIVVIGLLCYAVIFAFYALIICMPLAGLLGIVYLFLKACGVVA